MNSEDTIRLISAATHVGESPALWSRKLSPQLWDRARPLLEDAEVAGAAGDPHSLLAAMARTGTSGAVLYPTLARRFFTLRDPELQQACFRVYNDWIIDYCQSGRGRLFGIALLSPYDIDEAVSELKRCRQAGLHGAEIWETPDPAIPFSSGHYESLWEAAQRLEMPISIHALQAEHPGGRSNGSYADAVGAAIAAISDTVYELIFYGVMERFARLNFVLVGQEIGWMPFFFQQLDYYYRRFSKQLTLPLKQAPSEYLRRQMYATFSNDAVGVRQLVEREAANYMWSSELDESSRDGGAITNQLAPLAPTQRSEVTHANIARLYQIKISN